MFFKSIVFFVFVILVFLLPTFLPPIPKLNATIAFILGIFYSLCCGNHLQNITERWSKRFLAWSIIGLGFSMNLIAIYEISRAGIVFTILGILLAIILGYYLGKLFNLNKEQTSLVSFGTAICGGSAIAVLSQSIRASAVSVSSSLAVVFLFNALALLVFPPIGNALNLSQEQFGLWSALAIHDTSSVIGASLQYGNKALEIATTVKLGRAIWIIPFAIIISFIYFKKSNFQEKQDNNNQKKKYPWFILWFLLAAAAATWIPKVAEYGIAIKSLAEKLLVFTLFLIGTNLTKEVFKEVGFKPFIMGGILWIIISLVTLFFVYFNYIKL